MAKNKVTTGDILMPAMSGICREAIAGGARVALPNPLHPPISWGPFGVGDVRASWGESLAGSARMVRPPLPLSAQLSDPMDP